MATLNTWSAMTAETKPCRMATTSLKEDYVSRGEMLKASDESDGVDCGNPIFFSGFQREDGGSTFSRYSHSEDSARNCQLS